MFQIARITPTNRTSPTIVPILPSSAPPETSADQVEESAPAGLAESGERVAEPVEVPGAVVFLPRRLVRPVDEQRPALDLVAGKEAPEAAVAAVVAVVTQHEQVAGGDDLRPPVVPHPFAAQPILGIVAVQGRLQE